MLGRLNVVIRWSIFVCSIASVFIFGFYFSMFHNGLSDRAEDWSYFGSYISGTIGPLLSFVSIMVVYFVSAQQLKVNDENIKILDSKYKNDRKRLDEEKAINKVELIINNMIYKVTNNINTESIIDLYAKNLGYAFSGCYIVESKGSSISVRFYSDLCGRKCEEMKEQCSDCSVENFYFIGTFSCTSILNMLNTIDNKYGKDGVLRFISDIKGTVFEAKLHEFAVSMKYLNYFLKIAIGCGVDSVVVKYYVSQIFAYAVALNKWGYKVDEVVVNELKMFNTIPINTEYVYDAKSLFVDEYNKLCGAFDRLKSEDVEIVYLNRGDYFGVVLKTKDGVGYVRESPGKWEKVDSVKPPTP